MSQEFEKIVLEKLSAIDQKLDEHTEEFKKVNKVLDEHTEEFKKVNKVLDDHTKQFKMVRKDIYEMNNKIIKSLEKMEEIEDVVEFNTQYIKRYHEESAKKIDISLKAYEQLNTRVRMNECTISNLKSKNFENDVRITALEDAIKQNGLIA